MWQAILHTDEEKILENKNHNGEETKFLRGKISGLCCSFFFSKGSKNATASMKKNGHP